MSIADKRNIPFYWGMSRKYIICFSKILSDLYIHQYDSVGNIIKNIKIPFTYATKTKLMYKELRKDQSLVNLTLPRISYRFVSIAKDPTRVNPKVMTIPLTIGEDTEEFVYAGKPYNYGIEVSILTKTQADMFQIIENILSKFDNDCMLKIEELPGITTDVQVISEGVTLPTDFDFDEETHRIQEGMLNFTLKGFIYPAIENDTIIKQIELQYSKDNINNIIDTDIIT